MDEIEDMIDDILNRYNRRWPTDIIDQVFVAIETNPGYLKRYHIFANGEFGTANSIHRRAGCSSLYPGVPILVTK